jgi:hypothetical protein
MSPTPPPSAKGERPHRRNGKRKGPKPRHAGNFVKRSNHQSGGIMARGPDLLPRKQVIATVQMIALDHVQIRDPRTGRASRSKWAKGLRAAGLRDLIRYYQRAFYEEAQGDPREAAMLPNGVTRLGEHFGQYLDDKPSRQPRITRFIFSGQPPSTEVPPRRPGLRSDEPDDGHELLDQHEEV